MVADRESLYVRPDRLDHACSVRNGDASRSGWKPPRHDAQIVLIERGRMQVDPDFSRARNTRIGKVDHREGFEADLTVGSERAHD